MAVALTVPLAHIQGNNCSKTSKSGRIALAVVSYHIPAFLVFATLVWVFIQRRRPPLNRVQHSTTDAIQKESLTPYILLAITILLPENVFAILNYVSNETWSRLPKVVWLRLIFACNWIEEIKNALVPLSLLAFPEVRSQVAVVTSRVVSAVRGRGPRGGIDLQASVGGGAASDDGQ